MTVIWTVAEGMLLFALLFAGVWLIKRILGKLLSPAMHYLLWAVVVAKLLIPAGLPSVASPWNLISARQVAAVEPVPAQANAAVLSPGVGSSGAGGMLYLPGTGGGAGSPAPDAGHDAAPAPLGPAVLVALWFAGAAVCAARLALGARRLKKNVRRKGLPPVPPAVGAELESLRAKLGIGRRISVAVQRYLSVPAVMGLFRPVIALPRAVLSNPADTRNALLHELAHWKRGDLIVLALLNVLSVVYWFNPLVWICFRLIRRDMESACDATALAVLGDGGRVGYVGTVLRFAGAGADANAYAAMGTGGGKAMKRRVEGMFLRKRSAPRARAAALLLAGILALAGFTTACQPNPTTPPVVNKGDGKLIDKIKQTPSPAPAASPDGSNATDAPAKTLREIKDIPETYQAEFTSENSAVHFKIDATVTVPGVAAAPVANVEVMRFTQEQVDKTVEALAGGATLYEPGRMTREEIQKQIVLVKADIELAKKQQETEEDKTWLAKCRSSLDYYKDLLAKTPDSVERVPVTAQLKDTEHGDDGDQELMAVCDVGGRQMLLTVYNNANSSIRFYATPDGGINSADYKIQYSGEGLASPVNVKLSRAEAEQQAKAIASVLDAGMELAATGVAAVNDRSAYAWQMIFMRAINGFPSSYERREAGDGESEADAVQQPVYYEKMLISIDDSGIAGFEWWTPLTVKGLANENVALLPFADIGNTAEKMLKTKYSEFFTMVRGNPENMSVIIDRVTLGLMRIAVKDQPGKYMLVPVWDFFGDYSFQLPDKAQKDAKEKKGKSGIASREFYSMLTVNAIDGSIINRAYGY